MICFIYILQLFNYDSKNIKIRLRFMSFRILLLCEKKIANNRFYFLSMLFFKCC